MKKILLVLCALIFAMPSFASRDVTGEGHYYAHDEDSLTYIKRQLLSSAFENVISKELKKLGFDSKVFWETFNQKFEESFKATDDALKVKYNIDRPVPEGEEPPKISEAQKKKNLDEYKEKERKSRFQKRSKFYNWQSVITQYKVKALNRSTEYPKARYIRISAKVDVKSLNKIYHQVMAQDDGNKFSRLIITSNFELVGTNWEDLGVAVPSEFQNAINTHWVTWFQTNFQEMIPEITFVSEDDETLQNFFKENGQTGILWLKINTSIAKKSSNTLQGTRGFQLGGEYVLTDLANNKILSFSDFSRPTQTFAYDQIDRLRSSVATAIYTMPLEQFSQLKNKIVASDEQHVDLSIVNADNLNDIFKIEQLLAQNGVKLQITTALSSFSKEVTSLRVNFTGDVNELFKVLRDLHNNEIGDSLIKILDQANPVNIKIVKISEVKNAK